MSGRSVNINAFAYWMLQVGAEIAIVDTPPHKAIDFEWIKRCVRDGGWRYESYEAMVATFIQKIALEMRFVGVHVFVSTQLGNTKTGVSTALKGACGNRFLMGPNASDNQRANRFSAPGSVADVPENVKTTPEVSKGVGVTETEGRPSRVFSGYFAPTTEFTEHLAGSTTVRRTNRPEPTRVEIAEHTGMDDLDHGAGQLEDDDPWHGSRIPKAVSDWVYSEDGSESRGAAAAALAAKKTVA